MKKQSIFVFLELKIITGELEFSSKTVHDVTLLLDEKKLKKQQSGLITNGINEFAEDYASQFYDCKSEKEGDYFEFQGGAIAVKVTNVIEITEHTYKVMKNFI